jgi:hypothetical protein
MIISKSRIVPFLLSTLQRQNLVYGAMKLPNCRFKFDKSSQLFIGANDEPLIVAAVCVSNPDCSPEGIHA